jgi:hypothetical protein
MEKTRILMGMLVLVLLPFMQCTAQVIMKHVGNAGTKSVLKQICYLSVGGPE